MHINQEAGHLPADDTTRAPHPAMRCVRERCLQTLSYEAGGLLLITPIYALVFSRTTGESLALMVTLSAIAMLWSPLHNGVFDWVDGFITGRTACARPHSLRVAHAASLEISSIAVTLPAVMWMGNYDMWAALAVDIGLTVAYILYAYVFHLLFDWVRPVAEDV